MTGHQGLHRVDANAWRIAGNQSNHQAEHPRRFIGRIIPVRWLVYLGFNKFFSRLGPCRPSTIRFAGAKYEVHKHDIYLHRRQDVWCESYKQSHLYILVILEYSGFVAWLCWTVGLDLFGVTCSCGFSPNSAWAGLHTRYEVIEDVFFTIHHKVVGRQHEEIKVNGVGLKPIAHDTQNREPAYSSSRFGSTPHTILILLGCLFRNPSIVLRCQNSLELLIRMWLSR